MPKGVQWNTDLVEVFEFHPPTRRETTTHENSTNGTQPYLDDTSVSIDDDDDENDDFIEEISRGPQESSNRLTDAENTPDFNRSQRRFENFYGLSNDEFSMGSSPLSSASISLSTATSSPSGSVNDLLRSSNEAIVMNYDGMTFPTHSSTNASKAQEHCRNVGTSFTTTQSNPVGNSTPPAGANGSFNAIASESDVPLLPESLRQIVIDQTCLPSNTFVPIGNQMAMLVAYNVSQSVSCGVNSYFVAKHSSRKRRNIGRNGAQVVITTTAVGTTIGILLAIFLVAAVTVPTLKVFLSNAIVGPDASKIVSSAQPSPSLSSFPASPFDTAWIPSTMQPSASLSSFPTLQPTASSPPTGQPSPSLTSFPTAFAVQAGDQSPMTTSIIFPPTVQPSQSLPSLPTLDPSAPSFEASTPTGPYNSSGPTTAPSEQSASPSSMLSGSIFPSQRSNLPTAVPSDTQVDGKPSLTPTREGSRSVSTQTTDTPTSFLTTVDAPTGDPTTFIVSIPSIPSLSPSSIPSLESSRSPSVLSSTNVPTMISSDTETSMETSVQPSSAVFNSTLDPSVTPQGTYEPSLASSIPSVTPSNVPIESVTPSQAITSTSSPSRATLSPSDATRSPSVLSSSNVPTIPPSNTLTSIEPSVGFILTQYPTGTTIGTGTPTLQYLVSATPSESTSTGSDTPSVSLVPSKSVTSTSLPSLPSTPTSSPETSGSPSILVTTSSEPTLLPSTAGSSLTLSPSSTTLGTDKPTLQYLLTSAPSLIISSGSPSVSSLVPSKIVSSTSVPSLPSTPTSSPEFSREPSIFRDSSDVPTALTSMKPTVPPSTVGSNLTPNPSSTSFGTGKPTLQYLLTSVPSVSISSYNPSVSLEPSERITSTQSPSNMLTPFEASVRPSGTGKPTLLYFLSGRRTVSPYTSVSISSDNPSTSLEPTEIITSTQSPSDMLTPFEASGTGKPTLLYLLSARPSVSPYTNNPTESSVPSESITSTQLPSTPSFSLSPVRPPESSGSPSITTTTTAPTSRDASMPPSVQGTNLVPLSSDKPTLLYSITSVPTLGTSSSVPILSRKPSESLTSTQYPSRTPTKSFEATRSPSIPEASNFPSANTINAQTSEPPSSLMIPSQVPVKSEVPSEVVATSSSSPSIPDVSSFPTQYPSMSSPPSEIRTRMPSSSILDVSLAPTSPSEATSSPSTFSSSPQNSYDSSVPPSLGGTKLTPSLSDKPTLQYSFTPVKQSTRSYVPSPTINPTVGSPFASPVVTTSTPTTRFYRFFKSGIPASFSSKAPFNGIPPDEGLLSPSSIQSEQPSNTVRADGSPVSFPTTSIFTTTPSRSLSLTELIALKRSIANTSTQIPFIPPNDSKSSVPSAMPGLTISPNDGGPPKLSTTSPVWSPIFQSIVDRRSNAGSNPSISPMSQAPGKVLGGPTSAPTSEPTFGTQGTDAPDFFDTEPEPTFPPSSIPTLAQATDSPSVEVSSRQSNVPNQRPSLRGSNLVPSTPFYDILVQRPNLRQ